MLNLGPLAFANPWLLPALAALPLLWWLLRVTPPAPRLVRFPAVRLLFGLRQTEETPARTPLWLLILRMTLAALIILALAHPLLNPGLSLPASGPLVLVVDNGWAAAGHWRARVRAMAEWLDRAERERRSVVLLATAPATATAPLEASGLLRAGEARTLARALVPHPWPTDHAAALAAVQKLDLPGSANVVWLSDGLADAQTRVLAERLQRLGRLLVLLDDERPVLLLPPEAEGRDLRLRVRRAGTAAPAVVRVRALADDGRVLALSEIRFAPGESAAEGILALPAELRNRVTRLEIEGRPTAGAVVLLDERWRRRPVGLVSGERLAGHPLLKGSYYLAQALGPYAEVREGGVADLLQRPLAVLILADGGLVGKAARAPLEEWIAGGGVLVRFAGPRLAAGADDGFVPVKLRRGDRTLGGALSWTEPMRLAPFEPASPFAGLRVPADVTVTRQVLAEPSVDLAQKTWARLADGTPLVTAARRGRGWMILVHTTASTRWSNLTLSGLFVEMMRRVVALSQGVADGGGRASLRPLETLDAFGRPETPPAEAQAVPGDAFDTVRVGPRHPPGFYGDESFRRSLNLSPGIERLAPLARLPSGVVRGAYGGAHEIDLKAWLLSAALALAFVDLLIALALKGLLGLRTGAAALILAAALLPAPRAGAETLALSPEDRFAIAATDGIHLAYVKTGDPAVDEISAAALRGLGIVLRTRTSVEAGAPMGVDPARDELVFFPLLYWPVTRDQPPPAPEAAARLNAYIESGGVLVLDVREGARDFARAGAAAVRRVTQGLRIPDLVPVPENHVLTKAFYLLRRFPGRWAGGTVWVERPGRTANDGVSAVVIGTNDWAGAWAAGADGRPLFAVVPGGEKQREYAFRAGVNLVMYALTGSYKGDQVHVPAILERLGQ